MSGRPQGRGRQPRRERSQRSKGRDNSADSVSSTRSERESTTRDRNGRTTTRRRVERRDERPRKLDDKPREQSDRDSSRAGNTDKRDEKPRRLEKPAARERSDGRDREPPRDLNRDGHSTGKALNSLDRHGSATDDSRLNNIIKRICRETDRDRRITAARQLEEFFNNSENYQLILKNGESVLIDLEDVLYERGLSDIKDSLIHCFGIFGGLLGYDARRYFQWTFNKLDSSASDEIKIVLLSALTKTIQVEGSQQYFRDVVLNIMSSLQNFLENVDSPDLLRAVLAVIMPIASDFPHAFAGHFRDTVDILVGWHIDTSQQDSLTTHTSDCLVQFHPYWASDITFSLTLLGQFLEDMEAYAEELHIQNNTTGSRAGIPSPYSSLPKLTALVRVFTTVIDGIGPYFTPSKSPSITNPYITGIIQRVIQSINMSAYSFYYEKLFIAANKSLAAMCNWLQMYFHCCCDAVAVFVIQQLQNCPNATYNHITSALMLLYKVINKVGTSMPVTFIQELLQPNSLIMKLRLLPDEAILSVVMKIYQGFLGIHDVMLMESAYAIAVTEMTDQFRKIKMATEAYVAQDEDNLLPGSDARTTAALDAKQDAEGTAVSDTVDVATEKTPSGSDEEENLHHAVTIFIFDLCALSEIATSKSAILGLWKLSPTLFELLTQTLNACEWQLAACYPAVQYTILHALYTHCQRNSHFLSSIKDTNVSSDKTNGDASTLLMIISKVLANSSTSMDTRQLCLVWVTEMLDSAFKLGTEMLQKLTTKFSFDTLANSILPLTFDPSSVLSVEVCQCLKMMIELKVLSRNCVKRCLQDCVVRLMDVDVNVREEFLSLIKIIPTDIITSFASRNLLQDRAKVQKEIGSVEFKRMTTSCEDVWFTRKSHVIKPPTGTFHSYNFQVIMAFIQLGSLPSTELQKDWLVRLFHSCNRDHKYSDSELMHFKRCESVLWFWSTWEAAQFCILSRLRTPLGRAQETFQAIEGTLHQYAREARAADMDEQTKPAAKDENLQGDEESEPPTPGPKPFISQLRTCLLLQFVEALEKLMYNAHDGCTVGLPSPPKSVRVFFRTNRSTCQEWLARIRQPAMEVAIRCGLPAVAVWHGMQVIQELKATGKLKGPEFEHTVLLLSKALCEVKSPQAIAGLKSWCAKVAEHKFPWLNGTMLKSKGWYEQAAVEYKTTFEQTLPNLNGQTVHEDGKSKNNTCTPMAAEFVINEVVDCYSRLSDWNEVEKWQKQVSSAKKHVQDGSLQQSMRLHVDMNYVRALSKFEERDFTAAQSHIQLIPSTCLNSFAESLKKSAWTLIPQETEMSFTPLWDINKSMVAAELCLTQAGVVYSLASRKGKDGYRDAKVVQAVKECIHQGASLAEGVVRVGSVDWPPLVSPPHMLQLQCATVAQDAVQSFINPDAKFPSLLQGDSSFTADPTRHNCGTMNQALRFASHLAYLSSLHGQSKVSINEELSILELQTAKLARKHENYSLAQRLLLKQLQKLGIVVQPDLENNEQNNLIGSLVRGLTSVSTSKTASRLNLLKVQRESAKLAYAIGHPQDAIGILSASILEFSEVREKDQGVSDLNSRSLVTLAKWLLTDRKLLTSATKTSSNVTPLVAKISSLCDTEEEFLGFGQSTLITAQDENLVRDSIVQGELIWNVGVTSVGDGVDDIESVCGQLLHLSTMQASSLDKAWFNLAGWCYRWGRKTVEQASTLGNVELLLEERDRALQNIPKVATDEQMDAVLSELGQAHSASLAHEEDIGDDDQFYDNGMDATRKQLLQVCPSLQDANPSCLEVLLSVWKGVRDRLFKHYHYAAKAYFMYLKIGNQSEEDAIHSRAQLKTNKSKDDGNVTATLRLLRLLVKHAGELRAVLEEGLAHTPTRPWKDIIPQLFSRLNHPETYVRQSVSDLLCRVASDAPHLIVYPAVVGSTTSMPRFLNKGGESEGILPMLVKEDSERPSSQPDILSSTSDKPSKPENDNSMASCYRTIVGSLQVLNPKLVSELQCFIQELRRITLLWEELWHGSLIQTHQDVLRRQQQLDEEIKRVNSNVNLNENQRSALIKEKHVAIMKPVVFALEQLQKITNQPASTPHEQWFHRAYSPVIEKAIAALRSPANPADPRGSWEPFKQLLQTLQARSLKKSALSLVMDAISPTLAKMKNTAIYMPGQTHFEGEIVSISSVMNDINILPTKTKPKKLVFIGSDGQRHTYLFKGLEDLHLDERIMQFLSICNNMFTRADSHRCPLFCARHYSVTPLGPRSGLIQWVDGAVPVFALYKRWQQREAATGALLKSAQGSNQPPPPPMKPSELFYSKMTPALKEKGIADPRDSGRRDWPIQVMRQVLEELIADTPTDLLSRELWCSSTGALEWWHMTKTYARSTAVMSMIGYIIGLGDRHLDNMLIDFTTGEVVHIDYNVCFEKGRGLRVPEKVPFRMTPNLEMALGVTGVEGMFRISCEQVLKILKQGRETLLTLLEAFVYDPLVDWTTANDNAFASAFYGGGAPSLTDSKENKKEMERGVTQSLFSSRVAEMKVSWSTNRDEMLVGLNTLVDHMEAYTAAVKHLKSMDVTLEQLKEQQEMLQLAVNNTSHPLHSLQAKFDEHVKRKSDHDKVLQSIKEKLGECKHWQSEHKVSLEMIHSQRLNILVGEILKPLDVGVPCYTPAMKFLKGAGQGNIITQCEQLESELSGLLHQRRTMQRNCLDLIHTYATVTSQFPTDYAQHNRTYDWMCWLQSLVQDSSTKTCQSTLQQCEETRSKPAKSDDPLSIASVTALMSMEVKLQSSLTEQNAKLIKFCERRKQESVETRFLSNAVSEAFNNLKKYISENQTSAVYSLASVIITALCSLSKRCLVMENTAKVAGDRLSDLSSREGDWFLEELCSMSGNVTQLLSLLREQPVEVDQDRKILMVEVTDAMKAVVTVHKVFIALQELMSNFRTIIVPEAVKSLLLEDQSVVAMVENLQILVGGEDNKLLEEAIENELKGKGTGNPHGFDENIALLQKQFESLLQNGNDKGDEPTAKMTSGQMLLTGFNGLFTKVESELANMVAALSKIKNAADECLCDVIEGANKLKDTFSSDNDQICSKLFFIKRLQVMAAFFRASKLLAVHLKAKEGEKAKPKTDAEPCQDSTNEENEHMADDTPYSWNAEQCYSEDDLAVHIRHFIAESVQQRILGLPSQALGTVVLKYVQVLGGGVDIAEKDTVIALEDTCKKIVDMNIKKGLFKHKQLSHIGSLTSAYDVAWRKHDFARRLDNNINLYKGVVQRAQLQLARFQWLYEEDLLRCPMRGNSMISPARAAVMADMRKRVQALAQLEPAVKVVEDKIAAQQSSIEQRLKWAAGANPGLNSVLKEFEKTVTDRKQLLKVEAKYSADVSNLSNALLHFELLRAHSPEVVSLDNTLAALVKKCKDSSVLLEKSMNILKTVTNVTSLLRITCPPEQPITLEWMKTKLESVGQDIASHKSRKMQAINAVAGKRDVLKSSANTLRGVVLAHQQLVGDVKALLSTMAKDEEAAESKAAKLFIATYNRLSEECGQLVKNVHSVCSGKLDGSDVKSDMNGGFDESVQELRSVMESVVALLHWVHDHLLALASPLMSDDVGSNGGKTPIAAPPPTFASALRQGNTISQPANKEKSLSEFSASPLHHQPPVILHREFGQSPANGGSPSTRQAALTASPRKSSMASLARDPKTGKALQQRNTYAISVWRRVKAKLDGRDLDSTKRMSVTDQVDYVIRESTSLDNLSQMYEGWTAWV